MSTVLVENIGALQDETADWADAFVRRSSASADQAELLLHAIRIERVASGGPARTLIQLPLLVHGCIAGSMREAIPIAAAGHFLDRSIAILDSFMDGDPMPEWAERGQAQALLAATTVLGAFPMTALGQIAAAPGRLLDLQRRLTAGCLRVSHGQQIDLTLRGTPAPELDLAVAAAVGKTGEMMATMAELAASLSSEDEPQIAAYAAIAREFGTAWQIDSDLRDLLGPAPSRDLANGTRSLPIAALLAATRGALDTAMMLQPRDTGVHFLPEIEPLANGGRTPEHLASAAAVAYCVSCIRMYSERAAGNLQLLAPREPAASGLRGLLEALPG